MKDRFDFEDEIHQTYSFSQQLKTLSEAVLERDISKDEIANVIIGISTMIDLHTTRLFDTFTQVLQLDEYNKSRNKIV
jgi:hypothetical protein